MSDAESRKISDALRMTKTGLVDDCINIWTPVHSAIALSEFVSSGKLAVEKNQTLVQQKILQLLHVPLPFYFEYFSAVPSGDILAITSHQKHDPVQVERFDALVQEYNGLVVQGMVSLAVAKQFQQRMLAIVRGDESTIRPE